MKETSAVKKNRGLSPIWLLPFLALSICGWLLFTSYQKSGEIIEIYFDDASGVVPDKTLVMLKGIRVGIVTAVYPDIDTKKIKMTVKMNKEVASYLVKDTLFWVVRPELTAAGIAGLDTILSGSYIGIQPGNSSQRKSSYEGLASAPPVSPDEPGLHLTLLADALGSVQRGTGIYYKNVTIGSVESYALDGEKGVVVKVFIFPQFEHLVKEGSRFCNVSGINIEGKLSDIKVHIESFAALLKGGVLLYTPDDLMGTRGVQNGEVYTLYENLDAADFGLEMTLDFPANANVMAHSTKVMYRGVEVGYVKSLEIRTDHRAITAKILLDPRAEPVLRSGTRFWLVEPKVSVGGVQNLQTVFSGSHITFEPGIKTNSFKNAFELLPSPPPIDPLRKGKALILSSEEADFSIGSPVYFKNIQVGEIVDVQIVDSGRSIDTRAFIYDEYLYLVSSQSVFWKYSGVELSAGFEGIDFHAGPITKVVAGGVSFTTPNKLKKMKNTPPVEGQRFTLYENYKTAVEDVSALQESGKSFWLLAENVNSLRLGSPLLYKNLTIGKVVGFDLGTGAKEVMVECFVEKKHQHLITSRTKFYDVSGVSISGGLDGLNVQTGSLQSIVNGGISCFNLTGAKPIVASTPYPLYSSFRDALNSDKDLITVFFDDLGGLKVGAPVMYKGIKVGEVVTLELGDDLTSVFAQLQVEEKVTPLFRARTKVWLEKAEISFTKVKNLQSVVLGPTISFLPGTGALTKKFVAISEPPLVVPTKGFSVVLEAKRLKSITVGSPVYYRQVQVGEVVSYALSPSFQNVEIQIRIENKYKILVRANSKFWNVSGVSVTGGVFSGVTVQTDSLQSIVAGGIAFATPEKQDVSCKLRGTSRFVLYEQPDDDWLDWNPNMILVEKEDSIPLKKK